MDTKPMALQGQEVRNLLRNHCRDLSSRECCSWLCSLGSWESQSKGMAQAAQRVLGGLCARETGQEQERDLAGLTTVGRRLQTPPELPQS